MYHFIFYCHLVAWEEVLSVKAQDLSFILLPEILEPKRKCMSSQIKGLNWVIQGSKSHIFREDSILSQTACLSPPIGRSTVSHCPPTTLTIWNYPFFSCLPLPLQYMFHLSSDLILVPLAPRIVLSVSGRSNSVYKTNVCVKCRYRERPVCIKQNLVSQQDIPY